MHSWSIRQRILASFSGILVLLALMAALSFYYLREVGTDTETIRNDSSSGALTSNDVLGDLQDDYALVLQHLLASEPAAMAKIEERMKVVRLEQQESQREYEKTIVQQQERALYDAYLAAIIPYWAVQERVVKLSHGEKGPALNALVATELDPAYLKAKAAIAAIIGRNEKYSFKMLDQIDTSVANATYMIMAALLPIFLFTCFTGYFLLRAISEPLQRLVGALDVMRQGDFTTRLVADRRDEFGSVVDGFNRMTDELAGLVGQVQKSGLQVTTSVTEIAATSRQQQTTASEIAATTAEIGATSTEISATSRQLVRTMGEVSAVAEQSATLAGTGQVGLSHMADTMRHVMEATKGINAKLVVLNEKAGTINQVVTTISKVAEQTNLLSLNAAIEAEKAGEHGRGFAVVATEIRRLADQTAVATYDISQTVKEIQGAVSSSVMGMDKFSDEVRRGMDEMQQVSGQLSQIIGQVQTLAPRVEEVNDGMRGQTDGAEQITQALAQLNDSAQQTVESLRQSSLAIDELNQVALSLRGGVSRFKLRT
ncbi:methyl-accepting chemotaxis protein [Massilia sp. CCM 8734]|uniref:methyl-accepting chemotaxis protein n=1 Tax=Massilia sp. CCM 8734 TaxID=2609283 RepID=UPI00141F8569|nr:methyl-accepting chemotaxis protein [Massilia sp. CCM 8734]NHZ96391.1 HAMP domain-containing protein [Massilia sp. CCM 8734]